MTLPSCPLCDGACADADLAPLTTPALRWLWDQVANTADRRGDPHLIAGSALRFRAPDDAEGRAAATGLLGGPLHAGQLRLVPLTTLTDRIRRRGPNLTPGAVAAHATGRALATRAHERREQQLREQHVLDLLSTRLSTVDGPLRGLDAPALCTTFRRSRAFGLLMNAPEPARFVEDAVRVLSELPVAGARTDRRVLASTALTDPHGLDEGQPIAAVVRALLTAGGAVPPNARPRDAWQAVGVDGDELTGGLGALGIYPEGWHLPTAATVTLPPIELADPRWPAPDEPGSWVFVTENPSVLTAARTLAISGGHPRLLCTSGTPSALEAAAVGALCDAGWRVAVRADFDEAGLRHVTALLAAAPSAVPWRMSTADYLAAAEPLAGSTLRRKDELRSPWDPALATTMNRAGAPVYEEALLTDLLTDLRQGRPGDTHEIMR